MELTQRTSAETVEDLIDNSALSAGIAEKATKQAEKQPQQKNSDFPIKGDDGKLRDRNRIIFNSLKHRVKADGTPETSPAGYFKVIPRKFSSKPIEAKQPELKQEPQAESKQESLPTSGQAQAGPENQAPPVQAEQSATTFDSAFLNNPAEDKASGKVEQTAAEIVVLEEMVSVMVFGDEWVFLPEEKQGLVDGWVKVMKEKGMVELPFWANALAAHAIVISSRLAKPKTASKLSKAKAWAAHKFTSWKLNRKK